MAQCQLSPRQAEIAFLIAAGKSTKQIQAITGLSVRTIEVHIQNAARRLSGDGKPRWKLWVWASEQVAG